jgi:hypothetical protein
MLADAYIRCVLDLYRKTPDTPGRARSADRQLATSLHQLAIPLDLIAAALVLATARRTQRDLQAPPLRPIRSLHYFLPVIDELLADPPPRAYCDYLRRTLQTSAPKLIAAIDHQLP